MNSVKVKISVEFANGGGALFYKTSPAKFNWTHKKAIDVFSNHAFKKYADLQIDVKRITCTIVEA